MQQPILLLETRTNPMTILTSRSLTIDSISSQGSPQEFCYDYQEIPNMSCFGISYQLLEIPEVDLVVTAHIGEEFYEYAFTL